MRAEDSPQAVQSHHHQQREVACRRMGLIAWTESREFWAGSEADNAKTDAKNGLRDYRFSTHNTLNEGKPRIDSKRRQGRERGCGAGNSGLAGENQLAEQAAIDIDALFKDIDYSCSVFSSTLRRASHVLLCNSLGLVRKPARQSCRAGECA